MLLFILKFYMLLYNHNINFLIYIELIKNFYFIIIYFGYFEKTQASIFQKINYV
jgi:hypothetical protein